MSPYPDYPPSSCSTTPREKAPGEYVNLGLGLPTLVSSALEPADGVVLHSENGMLGFGPLAAKGEEDLDSYNASGQLVQQYPGASYFDSASAFARARPSWWSAAPIR